MAECGVVDRYDDRAGAAGRLLHARAYGSVRRIFQRWQRQRGIAALERLDDHLLSDIGLSRSDILWARSLAGERNPVAALAALVEARRRG
jgi:uncharacterized protein YjiS (DUF1127 family)